MAMQAFPIVVRTVKFEPLRYGPEIVHIQMSQTPELRRNAAVERIIRVAGIASGCTRNQIVLKVHRGDVARIVYQ